MNGALRVLKEEPHHRLPSRRPVAELLDICGGIVMWRPWGDAGNRNAIRGDKFTGQAEAFVEQRAGKNSSH
jgi:hypothetical protein